jgi:metal-responsive CopG/Arc/MetJ family transcriptional regulator
MKKRKEIKLDDALMKELERLAKEDRRNVSNFIQKILVEYVDSRKEKPGK